MNEKILEFYQQTSCYTDLGYYKDFAVKLPNDIEKLCVLQRMQIIHPVAFKNEEVRSEKFWGDIDKIPITRLIYEDDIFPTAQSILAELLRKNPEYNTKRKAQDKVHVTCRGQAILLASILKAKNIPTRVRSGFGEYIYDDGKYYDHWITEYFDRKVDRWKLVDADEHCFKNNFDLNDMPYDKFLFGGEAWLKIRKNEFENEKVVYTSNPITIGLKAAIRGMFFDFHSLMNDEIIFLHLPKYICDKNFNLDNQELEEIDNLAELMLEPDKNFDKLLEIWNKDIKFRIMKGGLNGG